MRNFVCHDAGKFTFILCREKQSRVHSDVAARKGKGIDGRVIHDEKLKLKISILCVGRKFLADILDVLLDFRVGDYLVCIPETLIDSPTDLGFEFLAQDGVRGTADVG